MSIYKSPFSPMFFTPGTVVEVSSLILKNCLQRSGLTENKFTVKEVVCNGLDSYLIVTTSEVMKDARLFDDDHYVSFNLSHVEKIISMGTAPFREQHHFKGRVDGIPHVYLGGKCRYNTSSPAFVAYEIARPLLRIDQNLDAEALVRKYLAQYQVRRLSDGNWRENYSIKKKHFKRFILQNWTKFLITRKETDHLVKLSNEEDARDYWADLGVVGHERDYIDSVRVRFPMSQEVWEEAVVRSEETMYVESEDSTEFVVEYQSQADYDKAISRFDGKIDFTKLPEQRNQVSPLDWSDEPLSNSISGD